MLQNEMNPVNDINQFNKISREQLAAEEKLLGPISEYLSKGSDVTYYKSHEMLYSRIVTQNIDKWNKQLEEEEPRLKYMSPAEIIQDDNMKRATCPLCGILCQSEIHMLQHKGMLRCRKKQAENKGESYLPPCKRPVHCDICDVTMQQQRWSDHVKSKAHKFNVIIQDGRAFNCPICDKDFSSGTRPKRMLKKHLERPIHLKKLSHPRNRASHDAVCKLHGFEIDTTKLLKTMIKVV